MNFFQTYQQALTNHKTESLITDLSEFGLQPGDWTLIKNSANQFKIQNKVEPDFYFTGKTTYKNGKQKWNFIQLAGL